MSWKFSNKTNYMKKTKLYKYNRIKKDTKNKRIKLPRLVQSLADQDYFLTLTVEERNYLNEFNAEFYNAEKKTIHSEHFNGEVPVEVKKGLSLNHNAIYRDLFQLIGISTNPVDTYSDIVKNNMAESGNKDNIVKYCTNYQEEIENLKEMVKDAFNSGLDEESKDAFLDEFIRDIVNITIAIRKDKMDKKKGV